MSIGRSEMLQHIPGNLEGHAYVQGCVYTQERPGKDLISHLWLTLRLCASKILRVRQSCKLPVKTLKACSNTHP